MQWFAELSQLPLTLPISTDVSRDNNVWLDSLIYPAYAAGFSAVVFLAQGVVDASRRGKAADDCTTTTSSGVSFLRRRLESVGGKLTLAFRLLQLLATLGLLGISVYQLVSQSLVDHAFQTSKLVRVEHVASYAYLSLLGFVAVVGNERLNERAYVHASWTLVATFTVYIYRDVWPLATTNLAPADAPEGVFLWAKVILLSIAAVFVPLFVPRKYTPVNPKEILEPNPAQTASLWSFSTFSFMSPTVWNAYRLPHLPFDMFPPLADYNHLRNIVSYTFHLVDPMITKSRQPFMLKLIRAFWVEMCGLASMSITAVLAAFAAPFSINNLLTYLERGGEGQTIKPWFWIALLFLGSFFKTISDQYFLYLQTRITVRTQAMVTELVFEHALRVRMKAETTDALDASASSVSTAVPTPDNASEVNEADGAETVSRTATPSSGTAAPSTSATKGKGKDKPTPESTSASKDAAEGSKAEKKDGKNLVGRLNNLVTTDLSSLEFITLEVVYVVVEAPLQIVLCIVFLQHILGWSAWVGLVAMIVTLPLPGYVTKLLQGTQREKMKRTDARVQLVTEMMNVIRMIKLFGWEPRIGEQLNKKREYELLAVRKSRFLNLFNNLLNGAIPVIVMLATFFTYSVIMKGPLTAAKVFSAISVLNMLRENTNAVFFIIPRLVQANIACERMQEFLENTELIDEFTQSEKSDAVEVLTNPVPEEYRDSVGIRHASFTWANDSVALSVTPGGTRRRTFMLTIEEEVIFRRRKINIIVGPTGAGKTSLLMALLGEMHYIPAGPDSFVNLPREGGVAYAAQESWVQSDTIRGNITFGAPFDEVRYNKVLEQCALKRDLELFDAGDMTEVGEKGITLSGGQKARITLARAVYSSADILLLDDILAALDVHTSRWIVDKCLKGDLLRGRTIILVTHNVAMLSPVADFVVDMGSDGRILSQGSLSTALAKDSKLLKEIQEEQQELEKSEQEIDGEKPADTEAPQKSGKLVVAEEVAEGHVGWKAMTLYLANVSRRPFLFWFVYLSGQVARQMIGNVQGWYLGYWAAQYEIYPPEEVPVGHYLTNVSLLVLSGILAAAFCVFWFVFGSIRAARIVHEKLIVSVLGTTLRWLDKTPTSRIIARCTEDIQTLDDRFAKSTEFLAETVTFLIFKMLAVVAFSPVFIIPAIFVAIAGGLCGNIYMKAQLSVKREMSNAKAPVLGHFGAAISGITSIRAYGAQEAFKAESYARIDKYSRAAMTFQNLNRWVTVRVDTIGNLFTTCLAVYLTYFSDLSSSNTGFSLTMAAAFSNGILYAVRIFNEFEVAGNSLERIQQYLRIEHEPQPTPDGVPPAYWPASGNLEVSNLSARYSSDGPKVLQDVSFTIASGERVGIVGRTGSGKSSLTLALLRCILTEGQVRYDGLETEKLNLDALRSKITIIPQVPELLSGTLRQNLDPFSEHDDAVLNDALRSAGLSNLQDENDPSRITLDSEIAGGGANLSVGQRQILALARAIVRRSKLLILDEATSAIDYETDSVIQTSLRTELGKDVTLLTVAHRLQTIMDADKIMVLDAGRIAEFGAPSELLRNEKGFLRALVDESGDREKLYAMATAAGASS